MENLVCGNAIIFDALTMEDSRSFQELKVSLLCKILKTIN